MARQTTTKGRPRGRKAIYDSGTMTLIGVRLPQEVIEAAKEAAYDSRSTLGKWIRKVLIDHLRRRAK